MPRIDISETIKMIGFPEKIWEWLDLLGDVIIATQNEANYEDKKFIADNSYKKYLLYNINKDLSTLNTIYFILRSEMIHQACSHVRLLCESLITLKYISLDPYTRSDLFWGYSDIDAYKITKAALDLEKDKAKKIHIKKIGNVLEKLKEKYEISIGIYSYTGKNGKTKTIQ